MNYPSFSIVLETENLETSNIKGLHKSIASLAQQDLSAANEIILIDSGHTPKSVLLQLQSIYSWLTIKTAPPGTEYHSSKMLSLAWTTGEIIVYYDSDCIYDRNWLSTILDSFNNSEAHSEIHIVSGETTTDGVGLYGTAMALCYIFPQYSGLSDLFTVKQYFLNNVAFRRSLLETIPIPTNLPLYRGNCVIHAQRLINAGYTIWRQPKALSLHAPPNGFKHYFQRFLLIGHDWYWQKYLLEKDLLEKDLLEQDLLEQDLLEHRSHKNEGGTDDPTITQQSKLSIGIDRISKMIQRDRRHAFYLPFCLPIVFFSVLLITIGYQITVLRPHYLRDRYLRDQHQHDRSS